MTTTQDIHRERQDALLARIASELLMDERFAAGWLTGGKEIEKLFPFAQQSIHHSTIINHKS